MDGYAVDLMGDPSAAGLLAKCVRDPIVEQRRAHELYDGEVDWTRADWSNPLLQQLAQLSPLSNHDLPDALYLRRRLRTELPLEHPTVDAALKSLSDDAKQIPYVSDLELRHPETCGTAAVSRMSQVYGIPSVRDPSSEDTQAVARKPVLITPSLAPPPTSAAVSCLTSLLHLSDATVNGDPQLGELVRAVAEANAARDPDAERLLACGEISLPDDSTRAQMSAAERIRDSAQRRSVEYPNRAFHVSDIVGYAQLAPSRPDVPSMHETPGYEPWAVKAIELGATDEPLEAYENFRDAYTTAAARLMAVEERIMKRAVSLQSAPRVDGRT